MARFAGAIDERTQDFEGSAIAYVRIPNLQNCSTHQLTYHPDG
jgi:hypothetical protein